MSNVSKVKVNGATYDIEDSNARQISEQAVQTVNEKIEDVDDLLDNANKIVEIGTEPTSNYTQVLVDPEEIELDLSSMWVEDHKLIFGLVLGGNS